MSELPFLVAAAGAMASYTLGQLAPEPRLPLATGAWLGLAACIRPEYRLSGFWDTDLGGARARCEDRVVELARDIRICGHRRRPARNIESSMVSVRRGSSRPAWRSSPRPPLYAWSRGRRIGLQRAFVTLFALPFAISIAWFAQSTRIFHWLRESMDSSSLRYIQATFFADVPIPKEHPASYLAYAVGRLGYRDLAGIGAHGGCIHFFSRRTACRARMEIRSLLARESSVGYTLRLPCSLRLRQPCRAPTDFFVR